MSVVRLTQVESDATVVVTNHSVSVHRPASQVDADDDAGADLGSWVVEVYRDSTTTKHAA